MSIHACFQGSGHYLSATTMPPMSLHARSGCHYPLNPKNEQLCSFSGFWLSSIRRHYLPNSKSEHDCSFSGFWPSSICRHYPPNSETEHSHSFLGFVAVSAIPNTKNAAFLAAFFVFGLFYSPFISPLLRHNKHDHFGHVFCVWVLLLHSKHDKCSSFGRIFHVWTLFSSSPFLAKLAMFFSAPS